MAIDFDVLYDVHQEHQMQVSYFSTLLVITSKEQVRTRYKCDGIDRIGFQ